MLVQQLVRMAYGVQDTHLKWDILCGGQYKYICAEKPRGMKMESEWLMLTETTLRSVALLHSSENNAPLVLLGPEGRIISCEHASRGTEMFPGVAGLVLFTGSLIWCTLICYATVSPFPVF